ncbi:MAG: 4Fe-4S binding protein [Tenericutes bacterium]|jgi:MinD superfamily P-loop ATPase|nr:4Fe-4S binding protein [Mycoplasmatota bacterium]
MQIAVLSGKGGAGKTLLAVNLANLIEGSTFLDCDVEEPNGIYYFSEYFIKEKVYSKIPVVDEKKCVNCNMCIDFCRYNALIDFIGKVKVLPSLCHSCGGCQLVCPHEAIKEKDELIGWINQTIINDHQIFGGELKIGKETGVSIIEKILQKTSDEEDSVIDCPPGNGCSVMESISGADFCLLVSEPTIFGLENLKMVYDLIKIYNKKSGIVINKAIKNNELIEAYALENNIPILGYIPFEKELALLNSKLNIVSEGKYRPYFDHILEKIRKEVLK